jgi:uncharacterized LabA/DUF88 family protein
VIVSPKDLIKKMFFPGERIAVFVDGANIHATLRQLDFQFDYKLLREFFGDCGELLRSYYYTAMKPDGQNDSVKPLVDFLQLNGWTTITKPFRYQGEPGEITIKGNLDCEITVDMIRMSEFVDHLVLFSGDGDFRYLIEHLQDRGKRVTVASSRVTKTAVLSNELAKQADNFIELETLKLFAGRETKDRARATPGQSK